MSVFYKKKKLIVCGCSYSDNYATREGLDNFEVYGSLLADKLDMELVNLSLCGFGNKGIFTSLIDSILNQKPPKDIGLVIAQWSEFQRVDGFVKTLHKSTLSNYRGSNPWKSFHPERLLLDAEWHETQFKDKRKKEGLQYELATVLRKYGLDSIRGGVKDTLGYMYSFQSICEVNNIPYLQFQGTVPLLGKGDPLHTQQYKELYNYIINSSCIDKMKETFLGWPIMELEFFPKHVKRRNKYFCFDSLLEPDERISEEDSHPNGKGHAMMAEKLYDAYEKKFFSSVEGLHLRI